MSVVTPDECSSCKKPGLTPFDEPWPGDDSICDGSVEFSREKWPRRQCILCGCICYESFTHYVAGDW